MSSIMSKSCITPDTFRRISQISSPSSPAEKSPKLKLPGPSRNGYDQACTFLDHIKQWQSLHKKGTIVCRSIQEINLHELINNEYPQQLKILCNSLDDTIKSMNIVLESMQTVSKQLIALAKLQNSSDKLFNTWSAEKLSDEVQKLYEMFSRETDVKNVVKENIAHCRDKKLTEVYASTWEYNTIVDESKVLLLTVEINLGPITNVLNL